MELKEAAANVGFAVSISSRRATARGSDPASQSGELRRLVAVIRIDDAGLLTLAADGPGNKRVPGARRLGDRSILANGVNRRSGLQLAVGRFRLAAAHQLPGFLPLNDRANPGPTVEPQTPATEIAHCIHRRSLVARCSGSV